MTRVSQDTTIPINGPQLATELSTIIGVTCVVFTSPYLLEDTLVPGATKTVYGDDQGLDVITDANLTTAIAAHVSSITSAGETGIYHFISQFRGTLTAATDMPGVRNLTGFDLYISEIGFHVITAPTGHSLDMQVFNMPSFSALTGSGMSIAIGATDAVVRLSNTPDFKPLWPNGTTMYPYITAVGSTIAGANLTTLILAVAA